MQIKALDQEIENLLKLKELEKIEIEEKKKNEKKAIYKLKKKFENLENQVISVINRLKILK